MADKRVCCRDAKRLNYVRQKDGDHRKQPAMTHDDSHHWFTCS